MANYQRINLLIDSSQRQNSKDLSTNFKVNLLNQYQVKLARLKIASIPTTFYNIRDEVNNFLELIVGGTQLLVIIPPGRYSIYTLMNVLQQTLQASNPTMTATFNNSTGKITIATNIGPSKVAITPNSTLYPILGFDSSQLQNTPTMSTLVSMYPTSWASSEYLTLSINSLSTNSITIDNKGQNITFLLELQSDLNTDYFGKNNIISNDVEDSGLKNIVYDSPIPLQSFQVTLSDKSGNILDLNGINWWAVIELIIVVNADSNLGTLQTSISSPTVSQSVVSNPGYLVNPPQKPVPKFLWL